LSAAANAVSFFLLNGADTDQDGIWIIDADGLTTYANGRMAEILGADPAELPGKHSFDYIFPEDVSAAARLFNAKKTGNSAPFRFRLRRRDGSSVWVKVQGTPMTNAQGVFRGIVGTFTVCYPLAESAPTPHEPE
jgi:PAS domain S-box-containing protein